jgi:DNA-directed RNA polymerase subunit RPC12/RpoP
MIGKSIFVYDTPAATNEWTSRAKLHIAGLRERLANIDGDAEREERLRQLQCPACWYASGGLAGQAFTRYTCQVCSAEFQHPNTHTPRMCRVCSDRLRICVECGADLELKQRRVPKKAIG